MEKNDILILNKFGIPEPYNTQKSFLPDILLVPLLAYDTNKNRLGYGKGFYDKYLNNLTKLNKKIEAIGIAFSFKNIKNYLHQILTINLIIFLPRKVFWSENTYIRRCLWGRWYVCYQSKT